jgi:CheY-like chemotaxis protein
MAKVTAVVNDLVFMTKIRNTAEFFGLSVGFAGNDGQVEFYLKDCRLILLDLENDYLDSLKLVERMKQDSTTSEIKVIGYLSHVNTPLKARAIVAGCDEVLSRFEFNANIREILQSACC